mmetsp:Transcript_24451/g.73189  ORF Transcript_24451/g.73189 Transcript_24451/m.73189 type:complete len:259 (-) Transcript_24451:1015-1791(-)
MRLIDGHLVDGTFVPHPRPDHLLFPEVHHGNLALVAAAEESLRRLGISKRNSATLVDIEDAHRVRVTRPVCRHEQRVPQRDVATVRSRPDTASHHKRGCPSKQKVVGPPRVRLERQKGGVRLVLGQKAPQRQVSRRHGRPKFVTKVRKVYGCYLGLRLRVELKLRQLVLLVKVPKVELTVASARNVTRHHRMLSDSPNRTVGRAVHRGNEPSFHSSTRESSKLRRPFATRRVSAVAEPTIAVGGSWARPVERTRDCWC